MNSSSAAQARGSFFFLALALAGCEQARLAPTIGFKTLPERPPPTESKSASQVEVPARLAIYSTLAGKMARMEELLNGIDRWLGQPDFQDRLLADSKELQQLLSESRGLYPKRLPVGDQPKFDQAIDHAADDSRKLFESIQANDVETAHEAIEQLLQQRQAAHTKYSN